MTVGVRHVAALRALLLGDEEAITLASRLTDADMAACEMLFQAALATKAMLRRALGRPAPYVKDPGARLRAVIALLSVLADELALGESDVDALLIQAEPVADRWLAGLPHHADPADRHQE